MEQITRNRSKSSKAFTLIELLVAVAVAALVISGVFMSLVNSMVLDSYNQNFTIAMNIARAKLEGVFNQRSNFKDGIIDDVDDDGNNTLTLASDRLTGNWRIDVACEIPSGAPDNDANCELKNIKVSVCWKERGGRIIGDCEDADDDGDLEWRAGMNNSPCSLETSIARR